MPSLDQVNQLAKAATDFHLSSFDGSRLTVLGSFDLAYYHDIELVFSEVSFIRCPTYFNLPKFEETDSTTEGRRFLIHSDEGQFEIIAESLDIILGKVFHYDRGEKLKPGERIADWVQKRKA